MTLSITDSTMKIFQLYLAALLGALAKAAAFSTGLGTYTRTRPQCPAAVSIGRKIPVGVSPIVSPLWSSSTGVQEPDEDDRPKPLRATLRGITGFSLTAVRASLRAATGVSITTIVKTIVGAFPLWLRYFMQPFLILYYTPLMIMKSWVGETKTSRAEAMAAHEKLVEGWKKAIVAAENAQAGGYWPIHVDSDSNIVTAFPPDPEAINVNPPDPNQQVVDVNKAVLQSVEIADAEAEK